MSAEEPTMQNAATLLSQKVLQVGLYGNVANAKLASNVIPKVTKLE
jgi:hypothetical protein